MGRLRPEHFKEINDLVTEVETRTTAEIVPLVLQSSSDYRWIHSRLALNGGIFGSLGAWMWSLSHAWPISASESAVFIGTGTLLGLLASFVPEIARRAIGKERLAHEVETRLYSEFVRRGCTETKDRTGVLVLVSLFERRIQILADRGIQAKMIEVGGEKIWETFCTEFAKTAARGEAVKGLADVIRKLATTLEKHFPDDGSKTNQLPNTLRTEEE